MSGIDLCGHFADGLGQLFTCSPHGDYQRIRTPYLYPDGDNVDLFCKQFDESVIVSDLGETMRWLRMQTVSPRRSPRQRTLIEDVCLTHGVELYRGTLTARCKAGENLSVVALRVAQAAMRVSDLWFTFRTGSLESVTEEVAEFLAELKFAFDRSQKLAGRSGKAWTPDFHVWGPERSSLVYVLASGSRSAARAVVNQVHTAWFDLSHLAAGPSALKFVSLFDDTSDVWSDEDFRLADQLSTVTRWSKPDEFARELASVA